MSRFPGTAGAAAIALAGLTACQPAGSDPKPPPTPPPPVSAEGAPKFTPISALCPTPPAGLPVVRIRIDDVAPKKFVQQTALFASNRDGTAGEGKPQKPIPEVVLETANPTRLDLDATPFLKKAGDVLLVEVELGDPDASFVPGPSALTAGDDAGAGMFCLKTADQRINPKDTDRIVRFYVKYVEGAGPTYGKYNLFLLLKDGPYRTPTVLDPKIRNSG